MLSGRCRPATGAANTASEVEQIGALEAAPGIAVEPAGPAGAGALAGTADGVTVPSLSITSEGVRAGDIAITRDGVSTPGVSISADGVMVVSRADGSKVTISSDVAELKQGLQVRDVSGGTLVTMPGDALFDFDKADIRQDASVKLAQLAQLIYQTKSTNLQVIGHTDNVGTESYNLDLSQRRAQGVANWLRGLGSGQKLEMDVVGRGEREPVASIAGTGGQDDPAGRQKNRVEILIAR